MNLTSILALIAATFIFALTPGPGVFAIVARAMTLGFWQSLSLIAGLVLGDLVYLLFAILGLAYVASIMGEFFLIVKVLGGLYLIWLGIQLWRTKSKPGGDELVNVRDGATNFLVGLSITASNPKVIVFYLGFLPAFIDLQTLDWVDIVLVLSVVALVVFAVCVGYALAAARARKLLRTQKSRKILNRSAAGVMMTAGTVLIARQ